jgi:hypothetical protein
MDADGRAAQQPQTNQPNVPPGASPVLYLAYTYGVGLEIPSERLSGVMDQHVQACQAAGPRVCQLIGSNRSGDPESFMQGYVSIRGEPTWLRTFMAGLEAQADQAGGRIVSQTVQSEDLTRQIVDTEAHLRAQTALRDRLQDLLRSRPGRLSDLLEVERELARVQGEIDATQSNLVVMRTRVAMSELTLNYQSAPRSVGSDTMEPLKHAFADFLGIIVTGFAAIIYVIAGLIPIAIIMGPLVWLALRRRQRRGGRFFGTRNVERAPPPPSTSSGCRRRVSLTLQRSRGRKPGVTLRLSMGDAALLFAKYSQVFPLRWPLPRAFAPGDGKASIAPSYNRTT